MANDRRIAPRSRRLPASLSAQPRLPYGVRSDLPLTRQSDRLLARLLLALGLLAGGCGTAVGEGAAEAAPSASMPIIVNLAAAEPAAIAAARERVLSRLEEELTAPELAAVTTFERLPAIALSATARVMFILLEMPEVASIERDREFVSPEASPPTFSSDPTSPWDNPASTPIPSDLPYT